MRPLRYSINVTLDACCDHRVISADKESHRYLDRQPATSRAAAAMFIPSAEAVDR